ncbi:MAG: ABC transporter permease [Spirochaetes bacterium GWD1_27_9]|nr:MAG: ABC transporter permease [Spirochaetes bacterium GWB1_27_13]OHD22546.1 MAG: ABC transporter permease [Spirochaetes bacterium GWC1_27_15]OHD36222.1 MAG: ABC transporter permease [Spirochaetes bacterium GWD1_27_9]
MQVENNVQQDNEQWSSVIKPKSNLFDINLKELWHYKDLIFLFVKRDFVTYYKQTILGPLWFLLQPLISTIVFTVIFGNIAKIPTDGLPNILFYMSGIVAWNYFSTCLTSNSATFLANAGIFGKVYFPRLVMPISVVISNIIKFGIQFLLFLAILIYFMLSGSVIKPNLYILITPLLIIQMGFLSLGFGILISALTTKYRDLSFLVNFGVQLWMYATPIVYPLSSVPEKWKFLFIINPMSPIIETFRYAFLGAGSINPLYISVSIIVTFVVFISGVILFNRIEKTFMDMV